MLSQFLLKSFPHHKYIFYTSTLVLCLWIGFLSQKISSQRTDITLFTHDSKETYRTQLLFTPIIERGPQGVANISEVANRLTINLALVNTPLEIIQPVIIKKGTCAQPGAIAYQLASTVDGKSSTTYYGISKDEFQKSLPLAIFTLSSITDNTHTACAEVFL